MDAAETTECVDACSMQSSLSRVVGSTQQSVFIQSGREFMQVMRGRSGRVIVSWGGGGIGFVGKDSCGVYVADLHTQGRLLTMTDSSVSALVASLFHQRRLQLFPRIQAAVRRALVSVERRLALAMALHGRLGLGCLVGAVPEDVLVGYCAHS